MTTPAAALVRPIEEGDFAGWLQLWDGYNAFYGRHGETALPREVTDTTWRRFFDATERVHAFVAVSGGKLVGLVHYLYHRSTTRVQHVCYLHDLFTLDSARGHGVGRALIQSVYAAAQAAGTQRVYWQTHESNAAARLLYDKLAKHAGFIVYVHEA